MAQAVSPQNGRGATTSRPAWRQSTMSAVKPISGSQTASLPSSSSSSPSHYTPEEKRHRVVAIMAASSGNLIEWFDLPVSGTAAVKLELKLLTTDWVNTGTRICTSRGT